MAFMRAKMLVTEVVLGDGTDRVKMVAVARSSAYPQDGADEDNTYAKFSPSAELSLTIANPALLSKIRPGKRYYVDFTEVPPDPPKA